MAKDGKIVSGTEKDLASTGIGFPTFDGPFEISGSPELDVDPQPRRALGLRQLSSGRAIKQMVLDAKSIGYVRVGPDDLRRHPVIILRRQKLRQV